MSDNISRKAYLDLMRIVACILVIFNHLPGFELYKTTSGVSQFIYMTISVITKMNVTVFFLISGALLLNKKESIIITLRKRVSRIIMVIFLFTGIIVLINVIPMYINGTGYALRTVFTNWIYSSLTNTGYSPIPYWFLYSYLGFLFMLPFLQKIVSELSKPEFVIIFFMHFLMQSFFPFINIFLTSRNIALLGFANSFSFPIAFNDAFFIPLIGYYLEFKLTIEKIKKQHIICVIVSNFCIYYMKSLNGIFLENYLGMFNYLLSIIFYITVKWVYYLTSSNKMLVNKIALITFGVYLLDPILKILFYKQYTSLVENVTTMLISIGWVIISFSIGGLLLIYLEKYHL